MYFSKLLHVNFSLVYLLPRAIPVPPQTAPPPRMVNLCQATQTTIIAPNPMLQGALLMQQMQGTVWIKTTVLHLFIRLPRCVYLSYLALFQVTCGALEWVGNSSVSSTQLPPGHLYSDRFQWAWPSSPPSWVSQLLDRSTHTLATTITTTQPQPHLHLPSQ